MSQDLASQTVPGATTAQIAAAPGASLFGDPTVVVRDVRHDAREVGPGVLFVARQGKRHDGLAFVPQAIDRGACAILAEAGHAPSGLPVPVIVARDVKQAMATAAELVYGRPTSGIQTVGITGTNGKTTTVYLLASVLEAAGGKPGVMGTLGTRFGDTVLPSRFNTPEADELARVSFWMKASGATHLLMEATSIALDQKRADGVDFSVAAFTNLTQDHLDYHVTMDDYGRAKARLFLDLQPRICVVNVDDAFGASLALRIPTPLLRVSRCVGAMAEVCPVREPSIDASGIRCDVQTPSGAVSLVSPLLGEHNLANLLLALGMSIALGVDAALAVAALASSPPVAGRLERCDEPGDGVMVLVDYAHTPDGLATVLGALRLVARGRVVCVFGCGGDRDRSKRPLMGEIAGRLADVAILTTDNPRSESPESIAEEVMRGFVCSRAQVHVELSRARAIGRAVCMAKAGDIVLIAGKGHETQQIVGDRSCPFDDRQEARRALCKRRAALAQR